MKKMINGKMYDTEKSKKLVGYKSKGEVADALSVKLYEIYKTENDEHFSHTLRFSYNWGWEEKIVPLSEEQAAKRIEFCRKNETDGKLEYRDIVSLIYSDEDLEQDRAYEAHLKATKQL